MRLNQKNKVGFVFFLMTFTALATLAQNDFKYRAQLNKADSAGFYKLTLDPAFVAKSENNLHDLRLVDSKGNYIPFVHSYELPASQKLNFLLFPEVPNTSGRDTGTAITVINQARQPISRIWIKLKNTAVFRTLNLTGSDDLIHWFAISESVPLRQSDKNNGGSYVQTFDFPASNYRYLKILVNDKNKDPIKFLGVGIYASKVQTNNYQPILPLTFTKRDSAKTSLITIAFSDSYLVNKVHLTIKEPKYFNRVITVYEIKGKSTNLLSESILRSNTQTDLLLSAKAARFILKIENGDDLPLTITSIEAYQSEQYVVSNLDTGKTYYLLTGNKQAVEPKYDLKFFTDSLVDIVPKIKSLEVVKNPAYVPAVNPVKRDYKVITWLSLGVALALLSFLTIKMAKQVTKKVGSDT